MITSISLFVLMMSPAVAMLALSLLVSLFEQKFL